MRTGTSNLSRYTAARLTLVALLFVQPLEAGVVAAWHFDEAPGAALAAAAAGTVDGTLTGDATFVAGGASGNALSLTRLGGGLVDMGDNFAMTSGDFSIVAWIKTTDTASASIVAKHRNATVAGHILGINQISNFGYPNKAWFYHSTQNPYQMPGSTTVVNDGQWHMIVVSYHAGGSAEIFVDAGPAEGTQAAHPIYGIAAPFFVGATLGSDGVPVPNFDGLIDELQLYDHALTRAEVDFLFAHPGTIVPEPAAGLLALFGTFLLMRKQRPVDVKRLTG